MSERPELPPIDVEDGYRPLFDGQSLNGWRSIPRVYGAVSPGGPLLRDVLAADGITLPVDPERHPASWWAEDGVLTGRQATTGYGGYLISVETFAEFDLAFEIRPDWPADTGVVVRQHASGWSGFQMLIDHRPAGGIGGFFGNGLASFMARPFAVNASLDKAGNVTELTLDDPGSSAEPVTEDQRLRLTYGCDGRDFLSAWRATDWNEFRLRVQGGNLPSLTSWVNGVKVAELDTATMSSPGFDPQAVASHLGPSGNIALEIHDNDSMHGTDRWGEGNVCRWRNIRIRVHGES